MPVLVKLKEEICTEDDDSPYIMENGGAAIGKKEQNGSVVVDYELNHQNSDVLSNSSSSAHKLGFKKKASNNSLKHKSDDPFRFAGDGIDFKAKLIGYQDVDEPRGDQMCQDAIQTCKAIVKRKGEHKQRILFNISLEGLKIKDQSGTKVLYTFPVSKVSFIAKDVTDNRAFGFVYGISEGRHKFYAIKTEKMADHVVFSIRDMFQIVYEMKEKQIEQQQQQQQQQQDNGQTHLNAPMPIVVSTPLQPKADQNGLWMTNGSSNGDCLLASSFMDTSQCPSAIPPPSINSQFDDFSANGTSVFSVFFDDNSSASKFDTPSLFNNAATDSSFFKTSTSFNGFGSTNGNSMEGQDLLWKENGSVNWGVQTSNSSSSPLSIGSNNSSGSHSPQNPCNSEPNSLNRSLTNEAPRLDDSSNGNALLRNNSANINIVNNQPPSTTPTSIDDAFAKLCNLDTLVITPSRSSPLKTAANGGALYAPTGAGFTSLHEHPRSTPPKREDPFAFMKYKPKKSMNELREAAAGPTLEGLELLTMEKPATSPQGTPPTTMTTNHQNGASPPTRPPAIPPRSGQNFPAIPRPDGHHHHSTSNGLLPPPNFGGKATHSNSVEIRQQKLHDPFADEFFT